MKTLVLVSLLTVFCLSGCFGGKPKTSDNTIKTQPVKDVQVQSDKSSITGTEQGVDSVVTEGSLASSNISVPVTPAAIVIPKEYKKVIYFDFDKSNIRASEMSKARKVKEKLKEHPNARVRLVGHADSTGTIKYNESLSKRRANSVLKFLKNSDDKFDVKWEGELNPVASNDTEEGQALNRRVEIDIIWN